MNRRGPAARPTANATTGAGLPPRRRPPIRTSWWLASLTLCWATVACGGGGGAVIGGLAGGGGGGGSAPAPTQIQTLSLLCSTCCQGDCCAAVDDVDACVGGASFDCLDAGSSQLRLVVQLTGGPSARLEIRYRVEGEDGLRSVPAADLSDTHRVAAGETLYEVQWDTSALLAELGVEYVRLTDFFVRRLDKGAPVSAAITHVGRVPIAVEFQQADPLGGDVGQDGDVLLRFRVTADQARDQLRLALAFRSLDPVEAFDGSVTPADDDPDAWHPALAVGGGGDTVDVFQLVGGVPLLGFFTWDSLASGLDPDDPTSELPADTRVRFRFQPVDCAGDPVGAPSYSDQVVRIDNNRPPVVLVDDSAITKIADRRYGIPLPFQVTDAESDDVQFLVQWTRDGDPFPELPTTVAELRALAALPPRARPAGYQLAHPFPVYAEGHVLTTEPPADPGSGAAGTLWLPELRASAAHLLERATLQSTVSLSEALDGQPIEVLRPATPFVDAAAGWGDRPDEPLAALPMRDDPTATLLLEADGASGWSVRLLDLSTGADPADRDLPAASWSVGSRRPTAMAWEQPEHSVLVADEQAGVHRLWRVDLQTDASADNPELLMESSGPEGALVALLSEGFAGLEPAASGGAALALVDGGLADDRLVRLTFAGGGRASGSTTVLADGLQGVAGLAHHPQRPGSVLFAAETGPCGADGRALFQVDVLSGSCTRYALTAQDGAVDGPVVGLALDARGARVLALVREAAGDGSPVHLLEQGLGRLWAPWPSRAADLPADASGPGLGQDGLVVLAIPGDGSLLAAGGVQERRSIAPGGFDPERSAVTVDEPFSTPIAPGQRWRIPSTRERLRASPEGTAEVFVWDSSDLPVGGDACLAVTVFTSGQFGEGVFLGDVADNPSEIETPVLSPVGALSDDSTAYSMPLGDNTFLIKMAITDLDGDGLRDIATIEKLHDEDVDHVGGEHGEGIVRLLRQSSPRVFEQTGVIDPGSSFPIPDSPTQPRGIVAADLDGNGILDLAVSSTTQEEPLFTTGPARIYWDVGAGPVSAATTDLTTLRSPATGPGEKQDFTAWSLTSGDLDGNGLDDLVVPYRDGDRFSIWFQQAGRVFDERRISTRRPLRPIAADVDGDGWPDLVLGRWGPPGEGDVLVYLQSGDGVFPDEPTLVLEQSDGEADRVFDVAAADLDGNGLPDIVSCNETTGTMSVFLQVDGDRDLTEQLPPELSAPLPHHLSEGGGLTFVRTQRMGSFFTARQPTSLALGDFDADGDLDLATSNRQRNNVTMFGMRAPGVFDVTPANLGDFPETDPFQVAAEDLDGDGALDLVTTNIDIDAVKVFWAVGPGRLTDAPVFVGNAASAAGTRVVRSADMDGDGDLDVVVGSAFSQPAIFFQASPGAFADLPAVPEVLPAGVNGASSFGLRLIVDLVPVDLDGDGFLDLATLADHPPEDEDEALADGKPTFRDTVTLTTAAGSWVGNTNEASQFLMVPAPDGLFADPRTLRAADLDGDGRPELLTADSGTADVSVFARPEGDPFDPANAWTVSALASGAGGGTQLSAAEPADMDGDGRLDVVVALHDEGGAASAVAVLDARGDPLAAAGGALPGARYLAIDDLDDDGDLDVVASGNQGVSVLRNQAGILTPLPALDHGFVVEARAVGVADLDGDGDRDILAVDVTQVIVDEEDDVFLASRIVSFRQVAGWQAGQPFAAGAPFGQGEAAGLTEHRELHLTDLDGDGFTDLLSSDIGAIAVRYNSH